MNRLTKRKKGFTLIEMLIAVLIFVSLTTIAFITLSRSAASTQKADELRARTEAARVVIDQLTNDFQFLYLDGRLKIKPIVTLGIEFNDIRGFGYITPQDDPIESNSPVFLVLRHPSSPNKVVIKRYQFTNFMDNRYVVLYSELELNSDYDDFVWDGKDIFVKNNLLFHNFYSSAMITVNLLPSGYLINSEFNDGGTTFCKKPEPGESNDENYKNFCSYLEVKSPLEARSGSDRNKWTNGYLKINLVIKPEQYKSTNCSQLSAGVCYRLETTLIPRLTE